MDKHTISVHAGQRRGTNQGVVNPVDPSTAFHYIDQGEQFYPRYFNTPGQQAIVEKLARLEHAETGLLFSSGMAAMSMTLLSHLRPGDHAVVLSGLYGGTHSFVIQEFADAGIEWTFFGGTAGELPDILQERTRLILLETPTNPLLEIIDMQAIAEVARQQGLTTVLDNTFASPVNQNPLEHGIDLVVHSGTKYLGGHSDLSFGAVLGSESMVATVRRKAVNYGGNLNGMTCYLVERSLKTLALRVTRQNETAGKIARFLEGHEAVQSVHYPGLATAPGHAVASRQMSGFGGMLSFELAGLLPAQELLESLQLITPAMSLGGVETTATLPVFTSHRKMPSAQRRQLGIGDRLVRLSVGIEDATDLIGDLHQGLDRVSRLAAAESV